jgi:general secretion pathway protein G
MRGSRNTEAGGRRSRAGRGQQGFTLLELLVVMTIIGILAAIAVPALRDSPKRAREATLRADLFTFRSVIDQYKGDKGEFPPSFDILVKDGYMRKIPIDPTTKAADWVLVMEEDPNPPEDPGPDPGIIDVHSNSKRRRSTGPTTVTGRRRPRRRKNAGFTSSASSSSSRSSLISSPQSAPPCTPCSSATRRKS